MLEILDISFDDVVGDMNPDDIYDFTEVVTVNVGEDGAGNYYYFHLVTNQSISSIKNKKSIFKIEKWEGIDALRSDLNAFIRGKLENNVKDDPYEHLSKYWQWEYAGYNS